MTLLKKIGEYVVVIVLADVILGLTIFGIQGYQIHRLNDQQAQITANALKNDCWSSVLDQALNKSPLSKQAKATLKIDAKYCASLPGKVPPFPHPQKRAGRALPLPFRP